MISEVNLSTFIYRLFHEYLSSIIRTNTQICQYRLVKRVESHSNIKVDDSIVNI